MNRTRWKLLFSIVAAASLLAVSPVSSTERLREHVVVLHGLARTSNHMQGLADYLRLMGYIVHNLDYPSTEHSLETLVAMLNREIETLVPQEEKLHFVGYSMGGILTRFYVEHYRPENLGRVIQLASPNKGSEVADVLSDTWLFEVVFGPAAQQLTTGESGVKALLGTVDYELAVIAGNATIDPISSAIIPGDDDGKVSVESTKVPGMREHIVVEAPHTFFPENPRVQKLTFLYLRNGTFNPDGISQ